MNVRIITLQAVDVAANASGPAAPAYRMWRGFLQARESVGRESAFYAWNWFGVGAGETGFGLRGMPAAQVVKGAF